jgi:anti-sigma factor RsiW
MSCAGRREALVAYLEGELLPAACAEFDAHLAGCEVCQTALAAERRLSGALASLLPVEPPGDFEARFWARIAREREAPAGWLERLFTRRFALGLGAAAAATVAAVLALRAPVEPDVDPQIVANGEDYELLEDLDVVEVVDVLEKWDREGDQG